MEQKMTYADAVRKPCEISSLVAHPVIVQPKKKTKNEEDEDEEEMININGGTTSSIMRNKRPENTELLKENYWPKSKETSNMGQHVFNYCFLRRKLPQGIQITEEQKNLFIKYINDYDISYDNDNSQKLEKDHKFKTDIIQYILGFTKEIYSHLIGWSRYKGCEAGSRSDDDEPVNQNGDTSTQLYSFFWFTLGHRFEQLYDATVDTESPKPKQKRRFQRNHQNF